jgi:Uma2 family endonuclease
MQEYMDSGVKMGWLFNPQDQQVEIFHREQPKEVRLLPTGLSDETVLPGFTLQVDYFTDD